MKLQKRLINITDNQMKIKNKEGLGKAIKIMKTDGRKGLMEL